MRLALLISLFVLTATLYAQECKQATVSGKVRGDESFSLAFGDTLELHLRPLRQNWGWTISVSPVGSDRDWTFPVTFPIRNGESQTFGSGYGNKAKQRLKRPARVYFLLNQRDYKRFDKRATETLESPDPNAAREYIHEVNGATVGQVTVEATDYDKNGPAEEVRWMQFKAIVTVPKRFSGTSNLSWSVAQCPARSN